MNLLQYKASKWINQLRDEFHTTQSPETILTKLKKEIAEFEEPRESTGRYDVAELADIQIMLYILANDLHVDLEEMSWDKHRINTGRKQNLLPDGTFQHV